MDLPTITEDKIFEVLTKEWQPITSLISKLNIKDMMIARSLQITLKNLEFQKKVSTRIIKGRKYWKLYDNSLNKIHDKIITLSQSEKINEEIKLLKENLDFLDKLKNMIQNGITGYELVYELKEYNKTMTEKIREMYKMEIEVEVETIVDNVDLFGWSKILKKIGNNKVLDYKLYDPPDFTDIPNEFIKNIDEIRERHRKKNTRNISNECMEDIKNERSRIINEIGYLEFLKKKPTTKGITEKIDYEKDLDDFIGFLDEKYEEWEKIKSGKKE